MKKTAAEAPAPEKTAVTALRPTPRAPADTLPDVETSPFSSDLIRDMERIAQEPTRDRLRRNRVRAAAAAEETLDEIEPLERTKKPTLVAAESCVAGYRIENIFVMVWRGVPTESAMGELHAAMLQLMNDKGQIAIISLIEEGAVPPDPGLREQVREFQTRHADRIAALALVVQGMGFWASAVLGAATAILSARRARFPDRVFRRAEDAARFLFGHLPNTPDKLRETDIAEAIRFCRNDRPTQRTWP